MSIQDTYSFLLDHPDLREMEACSRQIEYMTPDFSQEIYQESRKTTFETVQDAYRDWVQFGKPNGLYYQEGKNTVLKLLLKVKDEPELLQKWIEYHGAIFGYHNLVIMDCGSTDSKHLQILESFKEKIMIFRYPKFYNFIHNPQMNEDFYSLILSNCKYVAVLDADEFLFGYKDGKISPLEVLKVLADGSEDIYAGTWIANITAPSDSGGDIDWDQPIAFCADDDAVKHGTFFGKSLVKSSCAFDIKAVGHNLQVKEVVDAMRPASFGKIGIFHISSLGPRITRARALKHLRTMSIPPLSLVTNDQIDGYLSAMMLQKDIDGRIRSYITKALGKWERKHPEKGVFSSNMLAIIGEESQAVLASSFENFDFIRLLQDRLQALSV